MQIKELLKSTFGDGPNPFTGDPTTANHIRGPTPDDGSEKEVDDFEVSLSQDFKGEGPKDDSDTTTDDISHTVCGALTAWFQQIHSGAKIQEALKQCKRPLNATALKAVQINPEVKKSMTHADEQKDQRLKWLCNAITKSTQPLAICSSKLLRLQFHIRKANEDTEGDAIIPVDLESNEMLNLTQLLKDFKLGLKVLGMASIQSIQKRHLNLQYKLVGAAKELAEPNQSFDDTLFGLNLKQHFHSILATNKMTYKMASPCGKGHQYSPFLGCSWSPGRIQTGSHGYNNRNNMWSPCGQNQHGTAPSSSPQRSQWHNQAPSPRKGQGCGQGPSTPCK